MDTVRALPIMALLCVLSAASSSAGEPAGSLPPGYTTSRTGDVHDFDYFAGGWSTHQRRLKDRGVGSSEWEQFPATLCMSLYLDGMVTVEPYNAIAGADGIANSLQGGDFYSFDKLPVFMAATPDFVDKNPDAVVQYLKAWLDVGKEFKASPDKAHEVIYGFFTSKGYKMSKDTFKVALSRVEVDPGFPADLNGYLTHHAEILLKEKKIKAIPDWKKALRPEFLEKARASA